MDRRSFFRHSTGLAAGTAVAALGERELLAAEFEQAYLHTAVTVSFMPGDEFGEEERKPFDHPIETPEGFVPCGVSCTRNDISTTIVISDAKGVILKIQSPAFEEGPVEFWRVPEGQLVLDAYKNSFLPCPYEVLTIFGKIPR